MNGGKVRVSRRKRQTQRITASYNSKVARRQNDDTINNQRRGCPRCGGGNCICNRNDTPPQEPGCGCGRRK